MEALANKTGAHKSSNPGHSNRNEEVNVMDLNIGEGAKDVPIGFGLSLAMNEAAMNHYSRMSEMERKSWRSRAGQVSSRTEMEALVNEIGQSFR